MKNCNSCNNIIDSSAEFCPYCGAPISDKAKKVEKLKETSLRLDTINKLVSVIEDEETLLKIKKIVSTFED